MTKRPEFELIEWIRERVHAQPPVVLGIGDDAASLQFAPGAETLAATDLLMEGVDFTFPPATPWLAGRKALAVNLSDIAAMAGKPTVALVSVALPNKRGMSFAKEVHQGIIELADEYNVSIAGGDTNSWDGPLVVSVSILGEPLGKRPIRRSGALPGDWIFVTGALGGSLPSGRHLSFTPRLDEATRLSELVDLHAMIDLSDGLAADIDHLLRASGVGAVLNSAAIPLTDAARAATDGKTPLLHGLSDGEDFELLFTISPKDGQRLNETWKEGTPVTLIGEISSDPGCWLRGNDGQLEPLPPMGWTHPLGT